MQTLSEKIDQYLVDIAWSLWTELGVAGVKRKHEQYLIVPEELLLLTAAISEVDPRLRDEALDWCSRHHHFISVSRLRMLAKVYDPFVIEQLSIFAATLNAVSRAKWPLLRPALPLKFLPSRKSKLPQIKFPALLCFRLRELFGTGARADLILFLLAHGENDFSVADAAEIGYSKRNLAIVLKNFVEAGILEAFSVRNQLRYKFVKRRQMAEILGELPKFMPPWQQILKVILPLRICIRQCETKSIGLKVVEIRNLLINMESNLRRLGCPPPAIQADLEAYWNSFSLWMQDLLQRNILMR